MPQDSSSRKWPWACWEEDIESRAQQVQGCVFQVGYRLTTKLGNAQRNVRHKCHHCEGTVHVMYVLSRLRVGS